MIYKEYGKTGKQVSVLGFGGMRFDTTRSLEENAELMRYAGSQGINYFDTAPDYCGDTSELIFGEAFKAMPAPYYISTKANPLHHDSAEKAREAVYRSLDRLGVAKIHFYHIWCLLKMENYALAMRPGGQYDGLLQCQEEGLIDHIVCSSHQPGAEIKQIVDDGKVEGILMGMNILNYPYRWDGVQAAYARGLGVVAMNPLAGSLIPKNEDKLAFLAADGETPTEAALRFIMSCPQITVALNGFTTRAHVDMACRVVDRCTPFTAEDFARVREHLSTNMNAVCTTCGYCTPCPMDIPVPSYMLYYNNRQLFNYSDERMLSSLKAAHGWGVLVGRKADANACIACRRCEEACTQHLNIVERLRQIAELEVEIAANG